MITNIYRLVLLSISGSALPASEPGIHLTKSTRSIGIKESNRSCSIYRRYLASDMPFIIYMVSPSRLRMSGDL